MQQLDNYSDSKMAKLRGFTGGVRKELTIMTRYPVSLVTGMGQVIIILSIFILAVPLFVGSGNSNSSSVSQAMIWGFVIYMLFNISMWEIGTSLRMEQTQGTLESLYMTPVSQFLNLCSRISITTAVTVLFSITGVFFASILIGGFNVTNIFFGVSIYVLASITAYGFGFMLAGLSIRLKEAIQSWINLMQFGMMIFCAMFFPFNALGPLKIISYLIPLSYYVDLFRSTLMGYPAGYPELFPMELLWVEWLIVIFFAIVTPIIGYRIYKKQIDNAKMKGNLATY
ncbi:MAG: ABC transporter permease [Candidatus Hodarchaeales archaeon]|jgi:ABC-2 type transport system permease protein